MFGWISVEDKLPMVCYEPVYVRRIEQTVNGERKIEIVGIGEINMDGIWDVDGVTHWQNIRYPNKLGLGDEI